MGKYILTKTPKGKKYLYEVKDESGNVISKRMSTRDYVACSINGEFYFGRLDLVGKGDYLQKMTRAQTMANYSEYMYISQRTKALEEARKCIAIEKSIGHTQEWMKEYITSFYKDIDERFPKDKDLIAKKIHENIERGKQMLKELTIAYLQ